MNVLNLKISIVWFLLAIIILPLLGFIARSVQLQKKQKRIRELETEMTSSHADILSLQGQLAALKDQDAKSASGRENGLLIENVSKAKLKVSGM
jgi:hypothetical protein